MRMIMISLSFTQYSTRRTENYLSESENQNCNIIALLHCLFFICTETRHLRWYGHVQRATSCINSVTRLGLPGTSDRGRPRKTWSACVRNDMTICNLDGVNPLDRNSWRTSVRHCQVLPTPESGTTAAP